MVYSDDIISYLEHSFSQLLLELHFFLCHFSFSLEGKEKERREMIWFGRSQVEADLLLNSQNLLLPFSHFLLQLLTQLCGLEENIIWTSRLLVLFLTFSIAAFHSLCFSSR